ncbi:MAG: flagellar assembly protein FliH [Acidobacteriota bacterium]|nr:flagellar assembly protein FliH [Acidobacteriota bacterium]
MSSRARLIDGQSGVRPYDWSGTAPAPQPRLAAPSAAPVPVPAAPAVDAAQIERDAFMKGYAQGERAGAEAAAARGEAVVRRLTETVDELRKLKADLLQKTEQQVVQLSLAIARRIVQREVTLDRELIAAMGRVALDRLGAVSTATIRLHPDDYAAVMHGYPDGTADAGGTTIVADPLVRRGGCLVQSDFGVIDVSIDAQIQELATALLGETDADSQPPSSEAFVAR